MSDAEFSLVSPELGPTEIDDRSINVFWHGFPSPHVRWHLHDAYEIHLIVAGTGQAFIGDHVGSFSSGHLVLTGPYLPHNWISKIHPSTVIDMRDYVVQFRGDLVQSFAASAPELKRLLPLLERACLGIEFHGKIRLEAEAWFENIINEKGPRSIALLLDFLERLSEEKNYKTLSTVPLFSGDGIARMEKLQRAIDHVKEFHTTDLRLDSIASIMGMSKSSFSQYFTKATGTSFVVFLNSVRIAHACDLLSATDMPITEICHAVGFNSLANFNRRFRNFKGLTPSEYRKYVRHARMSGVGDK